MVWDQNVKEKSKIVPVTLRPVELPAGERNPIDRLLAGYYAKNNVEIVSSVDDRVFARCVYLDTIGLLPTPEQLDEFLRDTQANKRQVLVEKRLAQNDAYADHWITFWQDLLRDGKKDLGSTDVFRPITPWLADALKENLAYDAFVRELVDPRGLEQALKNREGDLKLSKSDDDAGDKAHAHDAAGFVIGLKAGLAEKRGSLPNGVRESYPCGFGGRGAERN